MTADSVYAAGNRRHRACEGTHACRRCTGGGTAERSSCPPSLVCVVFGLPDPSGLTRRILPRTVVGSRAFLFPVGQLAHSMIHCSTLPTSAFKWTRFQSSSETILPSQTWCRSKDVQENLGHRMSKPSMRKIFVTNCFKASATNSIKKPTFKRRKSSTVHAMMSSRCAKPPWRQCQDLSRRKWDASDEGLANRHKRW